MPGKRRQPAVTPHDGMALAFLEGAPLLAEIAAELVGIDAIFMDMPVYRKIDVCVYIPT